MQPPLNKNDRRYFFVSFYLFPFICCFILFFVIYFEY